MTMLLGTWRSLFGGRRKTYADKVLSYSPLVYYQMNETAGLTAVNLGTLGVAANGTYTGVTLNNATGPDGVNGAPFFDGANDYLDFFTAAFDAAFNGATGSAALWIRVANAGVWTDGTQRYPIDIYDDANNGYLIKRTAVNNQTRGEGEANAGACLMNHATGPTTAWFHAAITWSDGANADEFIYYISGAATAAACASLNVWNGGGLTANAVCIGAQNTAPAAVWHGWLAHAAVWDKVLTPAEILDLASATP